MPGNKPYRVAIIGCGRIAAKDHVPSYLSQGDRIELIACADPREESCERLAKTFGIPKTYTDPQRMLEECRPDLVSVCTPNNYPKPWSIAALRAGAHVFCEKPVVLNRADAETIFTVADKMGKLFMPCQNTRMRRYQTVKTLIDGGMLGDIYFIDLERIRRRGVPVWGTFHMKSENGAGAFCDMGVHYIDLLTYLMDNPCLEAVTGKTWNAIAGKDYHDELFQKIAMQNDSEYVLRTYRDDEFSVEDCAAGFIRYANGVGVNLKFAWAINLMTSFTMRIAGTKGGLFYDDSRPDYWMYYTQIDGRQAETKIPNLIVKDFESGGHIRLIKHALDVLDGETDYIVKREEILEVATIIEAFYKSAQIGREVLRSDIII
jgi:predicted dehydrogenase